MQTHSEKNEGILYSFKNMFALPPVINKKKKLDDFSVKLWMHPFVQHYLLMEKGQENMPTFQTGSSYYDFYLWTRWLCLLKILRNLQHTQALELVVSSSSLQKKRSIHKNQFYFNKLAMTDCISELKLTFTVALKKMKYLGTIKNIFIYLKNIYLFLL